MKLNETAGGGRCGKGGWKRKNREKVEAERKIRRKERQCEKTIEPWTAGDALKR